MHFLGLAYPKNPKLYFWGLACVFVMMGDDGGCSITDSDGSLAARVGDGGLPPVLSTRGLRWAHCGGPTCGLRRTVGVLRAV